MRLTHIQQKRENGKAAVSSYVAEFFNGKINQLKLTTLVIKALVTSLVTVKNLSVMQETQVRSLGKEDPLEKEWQATSVFWPGEFHGQRSLAGYSPRGRKELDMTERITDKADSKS